MIILLYGIAVRFLEVRLKFGFGLEAQLIDGTFWATNPPVSHLQMRLKRLRSAHVNLTVKAKVVSA